MRDYKKESFLLRLDKAESIFNRYFKEDVSVLKNNIITILDELPILKILHTEMSFTDSPSIWMNIIFTPFKYKIEIFEDNTSLCSIYKNGIFDKTIEGNPLEILKEKLSYN